MIDTMTLCLILSLFGNLCFLGILYMVFTAPVGPWA
ncbi:hypothetical protein Cp1R7AA1_188 [Mesorhizobium phage Cp1R7A-A1]|nr:hypothetical protein Cp1R7AA1_188 [Mesorhizobium phage Cp1R7A-A1]